MTRVPRPVIALALAATLTWPAAAVTALVSPALRFAVIGDNGTGQEPQYAVARQMVKNHAMMPFEFVLMMGDNMYGSQNRAISSTSSRSRTARCCGWGFRSLRHSAITTTPTIVTIHSST